MSLSIRMQIDAITYFDLGVLAREGRMMRKYVLYLTITLFTVSVASAGPSITKNNTFDNNLAAALFALFGWDVNSARLTPAKPVGSTTVPEGGYVELNAQTDYSVTFETDTGQTYMLLFDMSGLPEGEDTTVSLLLEALNQSEEFSIDVTGFTSDDLTWVTKYWSFIAEDEETTFTFSSTSALSAYLDNIRLYAVEAVPVPGAILLAGLGLTGTLGLRRRWSR